MASAGLDVEHRFRHWRYDPPLKTSAFVMAVVMVLILVFVFLQYHGDFPRRARLTVMAPRAGLFLALRSPTTASRSAASAPWTLSRSGALMAAIGFGNTGADVFGRGGPFLVRTARDLIPASGLLDTYSPSLFCSFRNFNDAQSKDAAIVGGNGFSIRLHDELIAAGNPYVYPDNLPRVNAHGGPEGKPGCWQPVTRDLWPAPYLVMDTGASIAPYNHLGLGQPSLIDYVWGRHVGENTINP